MAHANTYFGRGSAASLIGNYDTVTDAGDTNLSLAGSYGSVTVVGINSTLSLDCLDETVAISNGTVSFAGGDTATVTGSSDSLTINGEVSLLSGSGNTLVAGSAGSTMTGSSGGNTFAFADSSGSATIVDFTASTSNVLDLSGVSQFASGGLSNVESHWATSGSNVVITDPTSSHTLTLQNTTIAYLLAHSSEIHT